MRTLTIVAEYRDFPAEGIQVISKTLVDGLRAEGHLVKVLEPSAFLRWWPRIFLWRTTWVFTHGPGSGTVAASWAIRHLSRAKIVWVATRPDVHSLPRWLRGRRTAHAVIANRVRDDLLSAARDAVQVQQFIGIDPARLGSGETETDPWPEFQGAPVVLHLGHLRASRGLGALAAAKRILGPRVEIVVQASPTFETEPEVLEELTAAGVHVFKRFESNLERLYRRAEVYAFTPDPSGAGSIDLPLGVLEAVACGTAVVSTPFGALPDALSEVPGVTFVDHGRFAKTLADLIVSRGWEVRPNGLPASLHASRVAEAVTRVIKEWE